jgi:hypothetical protein
MPPHMPGSDSFPRCICLPAFHCPQQRKSAFMLSSVGARFRKQLAGLMATLGHCQPHYIR